MLNFLKLISPTQSAIKLSIGKRRLNCTGLVAKPEFAEFMQMFSHKIRWMYVNCANLDFEKFYVDDASVILLNLSLVQIQHVGDKVCLQFGEKNFNKIKFSRYVSSF